MSAAPLHTRNGQKIMAMLAQAGLVSADIWEIDSDIIAVNPLKLTVLNAYLDQYDFDSYKVWLDRGYRASLKAYGSAGSCTVLHKSGGSVGLSTMDRLATSQTLDLSIEPPLDMSNQTAFTNQVAQMMVLPAGVPAQQGSLEYFIVRNSYNGASMWLENTWHRKYSISSSMGKTLGRTTIAPAYVSANFRYAAPCSRTDGVTSTWNHPTYGQISAATLASYSAEYRSGVNGVMKMSNDAISEGLLAPLADESKQNWVLVSGPAVLTRGEFYDDIKWIMATNEDIAQVFRTYADVEPDANTKVKLRAQADGLVARGNTALVAFKSTGVLNAFAFCPLTADQAGALAGFPSSPDVNMPLARARWESNEWQVGVCAGTVSVDDYVAAFKHVPATVTVTRVSNEGYRFSHLESLYSPEDATSNVTDLRHAKKTIVYVDERSDKSLLANPVGLAVTNVLPALPVYKSMDGPSGDMGGLGFAIIDALFAPDDKKRNTSRAMVDPRFIGVNLETS